ncbi:MAG: nucleoside deaminase [Acidobacteria bacterium]|nr:nucleoside deaminase [Acidobacteriota bacterium]
MARAIELSIENVRSGNGGPFAALVVQNGKIIAEGTNQVTSANDPSSHAEIVAIRKACQVLKHFQLTGCEIYTTCEPCPMCMAAIYWARPARVYYANTAEDAARFGFDDDFIRQELRRPSSHRKIPMMQIMREEALAAFPIWDQKADKIKY